MKIILICSTAILCSIAVFFSFYSQKDTDVYKIGFYGRDTIDILEFNLETGKENQLSQALTCDKRLNDLVVFRNGEPVAGRVLCGKVLEMKSVNY